MCRLLMVMCLIWQACAVHASTLAPEHELQRLLIVARESLQAADNAQTREALKRIEELGIDAGANYYFYLGQLEANSGNRDAANTALIEYVNRAGSEGEFYQRALRLITKLEQTKPAETALSDPKDLSGALTGERNQYIASLKKLYLTDNPEQALVEHINSILSENIFIPGRIRRPGSNEGLVYKVATNSLKELVIQESDYRKARPGHSMQSIPVYGVDPYLSGECDYNQRMCWLSHPLKSQQRWITIADNPSALTELSKALTQLIRQLQQ
jgi:hypothetical protein